MDIWIDKGGRPASPFQQVLLAQMAVAEVMGVPLMNLCRPTRGDKQAALARQVAMYLCHLVFALKVGDIALAFGRDRATVRYALRSIDVARNDVALDRSLGWLEASLRRAGEPHV